MALAQASNMKTLSLLCINNEMSHASIAPAQYFEGFGIIRTQHDRTVTLRTIHQLTNTVVNIEEYNSLTTWRASHQISELMKNKYYLFTMNGV